ncbi:MAG: hypothetical protein Q4E75_06685 [bacterium]|nr:hypothetical protein [bacterium]
MIEKFKSRKFWVALLTNIVSITVVFTKMGGTAGIVAGIIGTIASSVCYMIAECKVDVARATATYEEVNSLVQKLKEKEVDDAEGNTIN